MKGYKGFDRNMRCFHNFEFEEGRTYEEPEARLCEAGFHACGFPLSCFRYYSPSCSVFHAIEAEPEATDGPKFVSKRITIGPRLSLQELVEETKHIIKSEGTFHYSDAAIAASESDNDTLEVTERVSVAASAGAHSLASAEATYSAAVASGSSSVAEVKSAFSVAASVNESRAAIGYGLSNVAASAVDDSVAIVTGPSSIAATTHIGSAAVANGSNSVAVTTGFEALVMANKEGSVALALGERSSASGAIGAHLVFAEWDEGRIVRLKNVVVDGEHYKPNVAYTLENGEIVEDKNEYEV